MTFHSKTMRLQHSKTIQTEGKLKENGRFPRITSICWSPNNYKFAISNSDRNIIIYDAEGNERDKFATKSGNKEDTVKKYQITAIQFSPDSSKLAIAQTDNIVYIYRLGQDPTQFGEKKTICNKFAVSSAVTAMCWPNKRNDELVFGLASGKLKISILKMNGQRKNKSATLFETNSFVNSIVSNSNGEYFYSAHDNKCIYKYTFPNPTTNASAKKALFAQLSFVPNTIQIASIHSTPPLQDVAVTSINGSIQILNSENGQIKQHFEQNDDVKLIQCAAMSPSGQNVVFGGFNCLFVLSYNRKSKEWLKGFTYNIDNVGAITSIQWKYDGSKLSVSSMIGTVDLYGACLKKYKYSDRFSIVYTALNAAMIVDRFSDDKMSINTSLASEIKNIKMIQNRYVVAKTSESLICGDMNAPQLLSEIAWIHDGNKKEEKCNFDTPGIVMIFYSSELFIVELGSNEILASCRTEYDSPHLVSLRIMDTKKTMAYLLDLQSICVMDLSSNVEIVCINHELRIEWIELNEFGNELLFLDEKRCLHLYHVNKSKRHTLLHFCAYAQWVPESNVIVAQNRSNLCVWYNIHNIQQVTIVDIVADVCDITRSNDKTLVICDEIEYTLNETLITFAQTLDNKQYASAVTKLERLCSHQSNKNCGEIQSMWKQISQMALKNSDFRIARRCFIALGDVSKAHYLDAHAHDEAKLAILNKQLKKAESIYISHGQMDSAILLYLQLNKYDDAIKLCKLRKHPLLHAIKDKYFTYLIRTQQHKKAAKLKETDGDYLGAVHLYLEEGFAAHAFKLIKKHSIPIGDQIVDDLYHALTAKQADYCSAGGLFEYLNDYDRAFDIYMDGHCYCKAVELAKQHNAQFGDRVTDIEAKWAQYLYDAGEFNNALHHFIESAQYRKAAECAIKCKQFGKAMEILKGINNDDDVSSFYRDIGEYYEECSKFKIAEKLYIKAGMVRKAVVMQLNAGNLDRSNELVMTYMAESNINDLYLEEASRLEGEGKIQQAAAVLVKANDIDSAILLLYREKKNRFDKIIQVISKYTPSKLPSAYLLIANQLKNDCDFKSAEMYYVKANEWKAAATMYDDNAMMDDALRVCRKYGGFIAFSNMVFEYCLSFGDDGKAVDTLLSYNLSDKCIAYLLTRQLFARAFEIAHQYPSSTTKDKLDEIHYQYALHLEDAGDFTRAEEEFVECNKAKEAIEMYIHCKKWGDAIRVSQIHEPNVIAQVYKAHGIVSMEENKWSEAEKWYIEAGAAEDAIKMYRDRGMYSDAVRLAQDHMPSLIDELQLQNKTNMNKEGGSLEAIVDKANLYRDNGNYDEAVDTFMQLRYPRDSQNMNQIVSFWEEAVHISMEKALVNLPNTIRNCAKQLFDICEYSKSAQYYLEINDHKSAIRAFISGKMFSKAKDVCKIYSANSPHLMNQIDAAYREYLLTNCNQADDDDVDPLLAFQHEYTAFQHAQSLFKDGEYIEALNVLHERGLQKDADAYDAHTLSFYSDLMNMVLVQVNNSDTILLNECNSAADLFAKCKKMLRSIVKIVSNASKLEELLHLFHLLCVKYQCCDVPNMASLYQKQCFSLLSYCDWIRCDLLFYDAGASCRKLKEYDDAFIFYNHFIDIADNMDDPDDEIDYTDFINNTLNIAIPHKNIPRKHIIDCKAREEIRDWVLEILATSQINPTLNAANRKSHQDVKTKCIVTAESLFPSQDSCVQCRSCHKTARKSSWNLYVDHFKTCPWCQQTQAPIY
eukprot:707384_1